MASQPNAAYLTAEQYLAIEEAAEFRSEYVDGQMYAMSGGTMDHAVLATNFAVALHSQLKGSSCRCVTHDLRVSVNDKAFFYPDILVFCKRGRTEKGGTATILEPTVVVEVLSPSTERFDRGRKFELYRQNESLKEYVLVSQETVMVEHFKRQSDGNWLLTPLEGLSAELTFTSIPAKVKLSDVYDGVFPPPEE